MPDIKPHSSSVSLDDLLDANRKKFDEIFSTQMRGGAQARPAPAAPAPAEPEAPEPGTDAAAPATTGTALVAVPQQARDTAPAPRPRPAPARLDGITLDLIEHALHNAHHEMNAVLYHSAISPVIREQHDEFPMITDARGRMLVGQFGSYVAALLERHDLELEPGDVILQSDPYKSGGAVGRINDWMVLVPVFHDGVLVAFASMFGHMMDVGGAAPGSMPTTATTIFAEGIRIPPLKLYARGELNEAVLALLLNNSRTPDLNRADLMALVAGCRTGEQRVMEICERFSAGVFAEACEAMLERTGQAMRELIVQHLPEEPKSFEDVVDDDGRGNGPFRLKLTVWREGEHAFFDWTGTAPQAPGPINFYLHDGMFRMFIGIYMIQIFNPKIRFNDGFYELIHVTLPKGSLLQPDFPAALGCHGHALARQFDVLGGAIGAATPERAPAAAYGSSPHFLYAGRDRHGRPFQLMEILFGGIPGRPAGDGLDGHSWWPQVENVPTEYLESYYPLLIERYAGIADSGGAGRHRGGNGVEKVYLLLADGEISIHDDRHASRPWGILGGGPGAPSEKWLVRKDGEREALASKLDGLTVRAGDRVVFRTAAGGGWGDPLERDPVRVRDDVAGRLLSAARAREAYGVVLDGATLEIDGRATEDERDNQRRRRKPRPLFDFGPRANGGAGNGGTPGG